MIAYGCSAGQEPNQVKIIQSVIIIQNTNFQRRDIFIFLGDFTNKISNTPQVAVSKANTPSVLFGIARKIAYANKKYHSGWICFGVIKGFAGIQFSGSIKEYPKKSVNIKKM